MENKNPFKPKKKLGYSDEQKKSYKGLSKGVFNRDAEEEEESKPKKDRLQKLKERMGW